MKNYLIKGVTAKGKRISSRVVRRAGFFFTKFPARERLGIKKRVRRYTCTLLKKSMPQKETF